MSGGNASAEQSAKMRAKIDDWLSRLHEIESAKVEEIPDRTYLRRENFVFGELRALSEGEIRSLVLCVAERPVLIALDLLAVIQQSVFHRQNDVAINRQSVERGQPAHYQFSDDERAAACAEPLRKLGLIYLQPLSPFARVVPLELWQDLANDYFRATRERISEGKVLAFEDAAMRDFLERSRKHQEKFAGMGYPGMLKGMGQ